MSKFKLNTLAVAVAVSALGMLGFPQQARQISKSLTN